MTAIGARKRSLSLHLIQTNVTSLDNRTCADIFYSSYAVSYAAEIATSLTHRVWENSRCQCAFAASALRLREYSDAPIVLTHIAACLRIDWQLEKRNSTIEYDAKTLDFERRLLQWRECVNEFGERPRPQNATICAACGALFDGLFDYYWRIYKAPGIDFCLDVESTVRTQSGGSLGLLHCVRASQMNDTMSIWHAVWGCADEHTDTKHYDITIVAFSATFLALVICLFYAGSYIQIEHAQRHSVRCACALCATARRRARSLQIRASSRRRARALDSSARRRSTITRTRTRQRHRCTDSARFFVAIAIGLSALLNVPLLIATASIKYCYVMRACSTSLPS